ncbi:hypothetical protein EX30DRAFT_305142 [Ascodesmis nigricans]|uniref:Spindle pole body component n=1 Tax=Ascodesmis nigricans TaxID=341454 RepID=A0A4S2N0Z0_9PEZI|nr:hypothetical protein EX30DRAFT_305142 [Ascodesmis nigricans]
MIWEPTVTLLPAASAPLGYRISLPPLAGSLPPSQQPPPLDGIPIEHQEALILEDLLFVLMGCEGMYIRFDNYNPTVETDRLQGPNYTIASGLDPSLRDLTTTLLKMGTHYNAVEAFVEVHGKEEFGAVNHALSSAIRNLLKDYLMLIAQLEHQFLTSPSFTLHVLHLHTLPTQHLLVHLYSLAHELLKKNAMLQSDEEEDSGDDFDDVDNVIESLREGGAPALPGSKICKGGAVLGLLSQRQSAMAGDPAARTLFTMLLTEASKPYMKMLNEWVHKGMIRDPHGEFLIKEAKGIKRDKLQTDYTDEYWDKRYTIRNDEIPRQLETVKEKILLAGKYLNVVRECGGVDVSQEIADVPQTFEDKNFFDNINSAYAHANESLLSLLLTTHALPARLRSLKHYFFLDRADFFAYFLELSSTELGKQAKKVNVGKLQSLLDLALRQPGSIAASDPFKEDVTVEMNETSLTRWLMRVVSVTGVEEGATSLDDNKQASTSAPSEDDKNYLGYNALQLDYAVPFPLSLVISRKTILRYQLLFRYLLSLRHLEMQLSQSWHDNTKMFTWKHKSQYPEVEMWKRRAWTMRARMLVFVQQLLYFCANEVVEPNWNGLMKRLGEVKTVDQLMQDHVDFLDTCLKECMLTNAKLLKIHAKLTTTCSMWASYTRHSLTTRLTSIDTTLLDPRHPSSSSSNTASGTHADKITKLYENLERYEDNFNRHLKILLDALNFYAATETVVLLSLCARLQMAMGEEKGRELIAGA